MIDQARLMATFQYLSSMRSAVNLYNTYRGLPLDTDTSILGVEQGKITTSVFGYQAVSMALEGQTYMRAPSLPGTLRAMVVDVDIKKKRAVLTDFSSVEGYIGMRRLVRVEPSETLEVRIYDGRQRIGGRVVDISREGMCIYTFFANIYGLKFEHDKEVFIDFKPPYANSVVRSKGMITSMISQEGSYQHRLGLKVYTSPEIKLRLDEYIQHRQQELMKEMEQRYLILNRKKSKRV
jgi:hypothetical protein